MTNMDFIHEKVNIITRKFNTRDPFEICKKMNIHIHYKDLGDSLKAYYFYQSRIKNIVINSRSDKVLQRTLCAHELGHAILHGKYASVHGFQELEMFNNLIPTEYEANLFAAELIVPDDKLFDLMNEANKTYYTVAQELYIPFEILGFKFRLLNHRGFKFEIPHILKTNFLKDDTSNGFS